MLHFKNKKFELEDYRLVVTNARLAKKVNKFLDYYYPKDTVFKNDDEVLFKIPDAMYLNLRKELRIPNLPSKTLQDA